MAQFRMNPASIIRCLLSHFCMEIANTTQMSVHDGHTELDTICIFQVALSYFELLRELLLSKIEAKLQAPKCLNKLPRQETPNSPGG